MEGMGASVFAGKNTFPVEDRTGATAERVEM